MKTLTVIFDVTGLTDDQIGVLEGEVVAQSECSDEFTEDVAGTGHPDVLVVSTEVREVMPKRTILVHVNVEIPADAEEDANMVAACISGALEVGGDTERMHAWTVTVPLAEEV